MKNKNWIFLVVFLGLYLLWLLFLRDSSNNLYKVSEWGGYFLAIPIAYCVAALIGKSPLKNTLYLALALLVSLLLLTRNTETGILVLNLIAVLSGAIVSWGLSKVK